MAEPDYRAAGPAAGPDPHVVYALGSSPGESARLQQQADELAADSAALSARETRASTVPPHASLPVVPMARRSWQSTQLAACSCVNSSRSLNFWILAGRRERELVDEYPVQRCLVWGQVLPAVCPQVGR